MRIPVLKNLGSQGFSRGQNFLPVAILMLPGKLHHDEQSTSTIIFYNYLYINYYRQTKQTRRWAIIKIQNPARILKQYQDDRH